VPSGYPDYQPFGVLPGTNIDITGVWPSQIVSVESIPAFSGVTLNPLAANWGLKIGLAPGATGHPIEIRDSAASALFLLYADGKVYLKGEVTSVNPLVFSPPIPVASGGTGTGTPALVPGTGISITGTWPNNTITNTSAYATLADPLTVAHGGTGTATPSLVAGAGISITGSWPNNTITNTSAYATLADPLTVAHGGTGTADGSITGTGALTFAAGGANQDVNLTPSGSGVIVLGNPLSYGIVDLEGVAGSVRRLGIRSGASLRWDLAVNATAEGGGNVGSDFDLSRYNDVGAWNGYALFIQRSNGFVGIGTNVPTSKLQVVGLPVYANNAAAVAGGLTAGAFYRTGADPDPVCVVH
jgi:hypothetical protein